MSQKLLNLLIQLKKIGAVAVKQSLEDEGATFEEIKYLSPLILIHPSRKS